MPNQRRYGRDKFISWNAGPTIKEHAQAMGVSVAVYRRWKREERERQKARQAEIDAWHANGGENPFAAWEPKKDPV